MNFTEEPIITQKVIVDDCALTLKDMIFLGHEVKKSVLNAALTSVLEERVFISGNKTVIF